MIKPDSLKQGTDQLSDTFLADFLLSFIQAFLKTGYYMSDHPEALKARAGLYDSLKTVLENRKEVSFLIMTESGRHDVFLSGIADEPVPLSSLFQKSMAELFIPKFAEYFERKNLSSFSLKSEISRTEFGKFIEIMTESPLAGEKDAEGREQLSMDLIRNDVLMVSTVFNVDLVGKGRKLPWRVEISLSRLKKDLNIIPMYRNLTPEKTSELRKMIFEDIIRPLNNPMLIKEILVNLDLISHDLAGITPEEFERRIIENFSEQLLVGVSHSVLRDFISLRSAFAKVQEVEMLVRLDYLRGILKNLSARLIETSTFDDDLFLDFVKQGILQEEDIPEDIRFRTRKSLTMESFLKDPEPFFAEVEHAEDRTELTDRCRQLFSFLPPLFVEGRTAEVHRIFQIAASKGISYEPAKDPGLFEAITAAMSSRAEQAAKDEQVRLLSVIETTGRTGIFFLAELLDNRSRFIRRSALDQLLKKGPAVVPLITDMIGKKPGWHFLRNALIVLSRAGISSPEIAGIFRQALQHPEPNVRKEALQGAASILGPEAEPLLLDLLRDKNEEIRKKSLAALAAIQSTHETFVTLLTGALSMKDDYDEAVTEASLRAVIDSGFAPGKAALIETRILDLLKDSALPGFLSRRKPISPAVRELALKALGVIGTSASLKILKKFISDSSPALSRTAAEAYSRAEKR